MQPFASSIDALQADVLQASDHLVDTVISTELGSRVVRQIYILTYSQANLEFFPTRQSFAEAVLYAFGESPANILQWVCAREEHSNGGLHYHMGVKLDRSQRWLAVKEKLQEDFRISVHFSSIHSNYYSAWKYVTKSDSGVLESEGYPDLWNSNPPRTHAACVCNCGNESDETTDELEDPEEFPKRQRKKEEEHCMSSLKP